MSTVLRTVYTLDSRCRTCPARVSPLHPDSVCVTMKHMYEYLYVCVYVYVCVIMYLWVDSACVIVYALCVCVCVGVYTRPIVLYIHSIN